MAINTDEKRLNLLRFALEQNNIPKSEYSIMKQVDDRLCLEKIDGLWVVYFRERGVNNIFGKFLTSSTASNYFYWVLTQPPKYTDFLSAYEKFE